jgi:hypothetical protein
MASQWALRQRIIKLPPAATLAGGRGTRVIVNGRDAVVYIAYSNGTKDHPKPYALVDFPDGTRKRVLLSEMTKA